MYSSGRIAVPRSGLETIDQPWPAAAIGRMFIHIQNK